MIIFNVCLDFRSEGVGHSYVVGVAPLADEAVGVHAADGADEAVGVHAADGADEADGVDVGEDAGGGRL